MDLTERQKIIPPHDWRIVASGTGPGVLFLHGAGASADSMLPLMAHVPPGLRLIAIDLPGHGRTRLGGRRRSGLITMAEDISTMLKAEGEDISAIVGHSAGGAIALAMEPLVNPKGLILINGALASFDGVAGWAFPGLARTLRDLPFASSLISARLGHREAISRLLRTNGMEPDDEMIERYQKLAASRDHIAGTLAMMGEWRLRPLLNSLHTIQTPVHLYAARNDPTVPFTVSARAEERLPNARLFGVDGGHLVHEADPELMGRLIEDSLRDFKLLG